MSPMGEEEKEELLKQLKRKWGIFNAAFQRLPLQLDTPSKKRAKESLESELAQCEADIQLLQWRSKIMILH